MYASKEEMGKEKSGEEKFKKAIEYYEKILTLDEKNLTAIIQLGYIYCSSFYNKQDKKKGLFYYNKVLKLISPNNKELMEEVKKNIRLTDMM